MRVGGVARGTERETDVGEGEVYTCMCVCVCVRQGEKKEERK